MLELRLLSAMCTSRRIQKAFRGFLLYQIPITEAVYKCLRMNLKILVTKWFLKTSLFAIWPRTMEKSTCRRNNKNYIKSITVGARINPNCTSITSTWLISQLHLVFLRIFNRSASHNTLLIGPVLRLRKGSSRTTSQTFYSLLPVIESWILYLQHYVQLLRKWKHSHFYHRRRSLVVTGHWLHSSRDSASQRLLYIVRHSRISKLLIYVCHRMMLYIRWTLKDWSIFYALCQRWQNWSLLARQVNLYSCFTPRPISLPQRCTYQGYSV